MDSSDARVLSHRLSVASRVFAAVFGGYAVATLIAIAVSRVLPVPRAEGVGTGILLSFAAYAGAVLWVFAARTASRAWTGLILTGGVAALVSWLSGMPA
jgi:hypothetical protein